MTRRPWGEGPPAPPRGWAKPQEVRRERRPTTGSWPSSPHGRTASRDFPSCYLHLSLGPAQRRSIGHECPPRRATPRRIASWRPSSRLSPDEPRVEPTSLKRAQTKMMPPPTRATRTPSDASRLPTHRTAVVQTHWHRRRRRKKVAGAAAASSHHWVVLQHGDCCLHSAAMPTSRCLEEMCCSAAVP